MVFAGRVETSGDTESAKGSTEAEVTERYVVEVEVNGGAKVVIVLTIR